eukprot:1701088-Rhodomonas_salina.2
MQTTGLLRLVREHAAQHYSRPRYKFRKRTNLRLDKIEEPTEEFLGRRLLLRLGIWFGILVFGHFVRAARRTHGLAACYKAYILNFFFFFSLPSRFNNDFVGTGWLLISMFERGMWYESRN